ncbi:GGDEF domain-containing protein, partial [Bosea sp. CER48]|uniref:GGDEF domain-containing protein n=1 Tax=Bosea sp. CER48 TaxID=3377035 RepID=UPI00380956C1
IAGTVAQDGFSGRLGGEEFAVYLPGMTISEAGPVAMRLLEVVRRLRIEAPGGGVVGLTVSIGAAAQTGDATLDELIAEADEQLYRAKTAGRNRVVFSFGVAALA